MLLIQLGTTVLFQRLRAQQLPVQFVYMVVTFYVIHRIRYPFQLQTVMVIMFFIYHQQRRLLYDIVQRINSFSLTWSEQKHFIIEVLSFDSPIFLRNKIQTTHLFFLSFTFVVYHVLNNWISQRFISSRELISGQTLYKKEIWFCRLFYASIWKSYKFIEVMLWITNIQESKNPSISIRPILSIMNEIEIIEA